MLYTCGTSLRDASDEEDISIEYLTKMKQGSHFPTLSKQFFRHSAYQVHSKVSSKNRNAKSVCLNLSMPQWQKNNDAGTILSNIILKAFVLNIGDRGKELGCLIR